LKTKTQIIWFGRIWFGIIVLVALILGFHYEGVAEADDVGHFQTQEFVMGFAGGMVAMLIYFVPSLIAANREHRNLVAIVILNALLGWTILGWVGALIWAVIQAQPQTTIQP
jgi:hypothetical protein